MVAIIVELAILFGIAYAVLAVVHRMKYPVASTEELRKKRIRSSAIFAVVMFIISQLLELYNAGRF